KNAATRLEGQGEEGTLSTRRSRWIRRESMPPGIGSWQPGRLRYREAKKKAPRQDGVEHRVSKSPSRRMTDRYDASTCRAQKQCNRKTCNRRIEFAYFRSRRASATLP